MAVDQPVRPDPRTLAELQDRQSWDLKVLEMRQGKEREALLRKHRDESVLYCIKEHEQSQNQLKPARPEHQRISAKSSNPSSATAPTATPNNTRSKPTFTESDSSYTIPVEFGGPFGKKKTVVVPKNTEIISLISDDEDTEPAPKPQPIPKVQLMKNKSVRDYFTPAPSQKPDPHEPSVPQTQAAATSNSRYTRQPSSPLAGRTGRKKKPIAADRRTQISHKDFTNQRFDRSRILISPTKGTHRRYWEQVDRRKKERQNLFEGIIRDAASWCAEIQQAIHSVEKAKEANVLPVTKRSAKTEKQVKKQSDSFDGTARSTPPLNPFSGSTATSSPSTPGTILPSVEVEFKKPALPATPGSNRPAPQSAPKPKPKQAPATPRGQKRKEYWELSDPDEDFECSEDEQQQQQQPVARKKAPLSKPKITKPKAPVAVPASQSASQFPPTPPATPRSQVGGGYGTPMSTPGLSSAGAKAAPPSSFVSASEALRSKRQSRIKAEVGLKKYAREVRMPTDKYENLHGYHVDEGVGEVEGRMRGLSVTPGAASSKKAAPFSSTAWLKAKKGGDRYVAGQKKQKRTCAVDSSSESELERVRLLNRFRKVGGAIVQDE